MITARKVDLISPEEYLASEPDSPVKREYVGGVRGIFRGLDAVIPLTGLKTELPLPGIYEGVEFAPEPEEEM